MINKASLKKIIIGLVSIIVIAAAAVLLTPKHESQSRTFRCYDCSELKLPVESVKLNERDFIDVEYEIEITKNAFRVISVDGYAVIEDVKYQISDSVYNKNNRHIVCGLRDENSNTDYTGFEFSEDFTFVRVLYNDGKYAENISGMWFGPCNSDEELTEALNAFGITD